MGIKMDSITNKLADALRQERLVRSIGQDPNVHWESIRDLRRECYAQTDEALAAYEQAQVATSAPAEPVGEVAKESDYWNRGHFYEGRRHVIRALKNLDALPVGTKLFAAPVAQATAPAPQPLTNEQIEGGRSKLFSVGNPYCPITEKAMQTAVRWAERAHGIGQGKEAGK